MQSIRGHSRSSILRRLSACAAGFVKTGFLSMAAVVFIVPSCALPGISPANTADVLPRDVDVPGWQETGRPVWHSKKSIALHLGDRSSLYTAYNVREMAYADFQSISGEPRKLRVTVYRMGSPLEAFGILSRERGFLDVKNPHIAPFADSYALPDGLYFRHGSYYITIVSSDGKGMAVENYVYFAHIITRNISVPAGDLPDHAAMFGNRDYMNNVVYYAGGHPEAEFLRDVFCRRVIFNDKAADVFYARRGSQAAAQKDFAGYLHVKEIPMMLSRTMDYRTVLGRKSDGGIMVVSVYRDWVFGIFDAETISDGERNIRQLFEKLAAFDKLGSVISGDDVLDAK